MERSLSLVVGVIDVRPTFKQLRTHVDVALLCSIKHAGLVVHVFVVHIGSSLNEPLSDIQLVVSGGVVNGSLAILVSLIGRTPTVYQEVQDVELAVSGRVEESCLLQGVLRSETHSVLHQIIDDLKSVIFIFHLNGGKHFRLVVLLSEGCLLLKFLLRFLADSEKLNIVGTAGRRS